MVSVSNDEMDIDFDEIFRQVMAQPGVHGAVRDRAAKIAAVARREMGKKNIKGSITIEEAYIPSGRYGVNIVANVDEKDRGRAVGLLRRASRSVRR